jgi:hypothetical protein
MRFKMETNQGKMMAKLDVHHEKWWPGWTPS